MKKKVLIVTSPLRVGGFVHILVLYFSQRHRMADINSWEKKYEEA